MAEGLPATLNDGKRTRPEASFDEMQMQMQYGMIERYFS
jgi:hypothetical protein